MDRLRGPSRLLLIRLSSLGDVLLATPLLRALAQARPHAEIDFLTKASNAPVLAGSPHLTKLHLLEEGGGAGVKRALRERRYDLVLDLSGTLRSRLIALSLARPTRTVRKHSLERRLMVRLPSWRTRRLPHAVARYFETARGLVEMPEDLRPEVHLSDAEKDAAAGWLGQGPPLAVLFPGARWPTKAWPADRFRALAGELARREGMRAALLVEDDAQAADFGGVSASPLREAGVGVYRMPLRAVAALTARARVAVANDSAMMHLAAACAVPAVALFGPTVRGFGFAPLGPEDTVIERDLPCRPCSIHGSIRCPLGHHECLQGIPIEEVLAEVLKKVHRI